MNLEEFSEREKKLLLEGKVIVSEIDEKFVTEEDVEDVQRIKAFVQIDKDTNSVVYTPTRVIGRNLKNVSEEFNLSDEDLKKLSEGSLVTISEENEEGSPGI